MVISSRNNAPAAPHSVSYANDERGMPADVDRDSHQVGKEEEECEGDDMLPPGSDERKSSSSSSSCPGHIDRVSIPLPPDGGYGWVIVFACFCCNAIVEGSVGSFGVFLPHLVIAFGSSRATTTIAGSLLIGGFLTSGPIVSGLINCFGCRSVTICGSVLTVAAFILSTLSPNIDVFIFVYGFLGGFGLAMVYLPAMVMVSYYFEHRRSLATGIAYSGAGVGMVVMAPVAAWLLGEFDWRNTFIFMTTFILQGTVAGALMRPLKLPDVESDCHTGDTQQTDCEDENNVTGDAASPNCPQRTHLNGQSVSLSSHRFSNQILARQVVGLDMSSSASVVPAKARSLHTLPKKFSSRLEENETRDYKNQVGSSLFTQSCVDLPSDPSARKKSLRTHKKRNVSRRVNQGSSFISCQELSNLPTEVFNQIDIQKLREEIKKPLARRDIFYTGSIKYLPEYQKEPDLESYLAAVTMVPCDDMVKPVSPCCPCVSKSATATLKEMLHLELFFNPHFFIICLASVFIQLGYFVPVVFVSDYAVHHGTKEAQASLLISVIGLSNVVGRAGAGALGSLPAVNELHLNNMSLYVTGIATVIVTFFTSFTSLVIYTAIFGLFVGSFVPLTTIFLVRYLGIHHLNNAMGLLSLVRGLSTTIGPPIAGLLLDHYDSHVPVFVFAGTMFLIAGSVFYLLAAYDKYRKVPVPDAEDEPGTVS